MFRLNGELAGSSRLKLDAGGSYTLTPSTTEHQKLWEIHAGAGYQIGKKQNLTLRMGVAGDGYMMNPYAGNARMARPYMGVSDVMGRGNGQAGGFVGVQWNALPTLQKLFGGK